MYNNILKWSYQIFCCKIFKVCLSILGRYALSLYILLKTYSANKIFQRIFLQFPEKPFLNKTNSCFKKNWSQHNIFSFYPFLWRSSRSEVIWGDSCLKFFSKNSPSKSTTDCSLSKDAIQPELYKNTHSFNDVSLTIVIRKFSKQLFTRIRMEGCFCRW